MKITPTHTQTVVFDEKDIPLWWKKWFKLISDYGIKGDLPVKDAFVPDWGIIYFEYGSSTAQWMRSTYERCKEIYK